VTAFAMSLLLAMPAFAADERALTRAKEHFRRGVALFNAGDLDAALASFLRSHDEVPSKENVLDIAICLHRLGRLDEALDRYEELVATHAADLPSDERERIRGLVATLLAQVATADVSADVERGATVLVDGRVRGVLPLAAPLRMLPGRRVVRVVREGHASFERVVEVRAGERLRVDAHLEPLAAVGGLRVEEPRLVGAEVQVDGVTVGRAPWEGTLAPGAHVVVVRGDVLASPPSRATVLQGQTTLLRPVVRPRGVAASFRAVPLTAELLLDGVALGRGAWDGELAAGSYALLVREEGYVAHAAPLRVEASGAPVRESVRLAVDPAHPRWPRPPGGRVVVGVTVALGAATSLGTGAEDACPTRCARATPALGVLASATAGYELPFGLGFDASVGLLRLGRSLSREVSDTFPRGAPAHLVRYRLEDAVTLQGVLLSVGASQRARLAPGLDLRGRVAFGALVASVTDAVRGVADTGGEPAALSIGGAGEPARATPLVAHTELMAEWRAGAWRFGAGLGALFVTGARARFAHGEAAVSPAGCSAATPGAVACAPASDVTRGDRAFAPFGVLLPQISLRRDL